MISHLIIMWFNVMDTDPGSLSELIQILIRYLTCLQIALLPISVVLQLRLIEGSV